MVPDRIDSVVEVASFFWHINHEKIIVCVVDLCSGVEFC